MRNETKDSVLHALSQINGVYVPKLNNITHKVTESIPIAVSTPIMSENSYFSDTFIIEIERGCYNRCGFCLASYLNLPVRFVEYDEIIDVDFE